MAHLSRAAGAQEAIASHDRARWIAECEAAYDTVYRGIVAMGAAPADAADAVEQALRRSVPAESAAGWLFVVAVRSWKRQRWRQRIFRPLEALRGETGTHPPARSGTGPHRSDRTDVRQHRVDGDDERLLLRGYPDEGPRLARVPSRRRRMARHGDRRRPTSHQPERRRDRRGTRRSSRAARLRPDARSACADDTVAPSEGRIRDAAASRRLSGQCSAATRFAPRLTLLTPSRCSGRRSPRRA